MAEEEDLERSIQRDKEVVQYFSFFVSLSFDVGPLRPVQSSAKRCSRRRPLKRNCGIALTRQRL